MKPVSEITHVNRDITINLRQSLETLMREMGLFYAFGNFYTVGCRYFTFTYISKFSF